jgi:hypothetical protein
MGIDSTDAGVFHVGVRITIEDYYESPEQVRPLKSLDELNFVAFNMNAQESAHFFEKQHPVARSTPTIIKDYILSPEARQI